ncbi:MAG: ABC transporter substrate-binding protein [Phycisphaeraceae bacterium]
MQWRVATRMTDRRLLTAARCLLMSALCLLLSACDQQAAPTGQAPADNNPDTQSAPASPTIVSLTPAVTQMLIDMGKREHLVGVSTVDDKMLGLPTCGRYNDPDVAKILALGADIVITESSRGDGQDVPALMRTAAARGAFKLVVMPNSRSIADVERALTDAEAGLGKAVGDPAAAERARDLMSARLELVNAVVKDLPAPRVLMLIDPATLGALGPGATHDEMLKLAGGRNAIAHLDTAYVKLQIEQVQKDVRPDVVLIFEPGGRPVADKNDARLRALKHLAVPAVTNRRIVVIDHPAAMLPSTASPAVVAQMAKAIHPGRAEAIDQAYDVADKLATPSDAGGGP